MLDLLLDQIDGAVGIGLYVVAMMAAVTVPDICAALRSPNGETSRARYLQWYEDYALKHFPNNLLPTAYCYELRCRLLHQGRQQDLIAGSRNALPPGPERFMFLARRPDRGPLFSGEINGALVLDVPTFTQRMRLAAEEWEQVEGQDPQVVTNAEKLLRLYPDGIQGFIHGFPVVG